MTIYVFYERWEAGAYGARRYGERKTGEIREEVDGSNHRVIGVTHFQGCQDATEAGI